jgi:hypothetical protein
MAKYQNGKIYRIICLDTGKFYIGSTVKTLEYRLSKHKTDYCKSREIMQNDNFKIELVEDYKCDSKEELRKREAHYQPLYKNDLLCVNCRIEDRTHDEWIIENKEYHKECMRKHYQENKFKIKQQHSEKAEEIAKYQKIYRENNKSKILQQQKKWRETNIEAFRAKAREYNRKNKDKINERNREKNREKANAKNTIKIEEQKNRES